MIILVTGLLPFDSGKTWLSVAITREAKRKGLKAKIFKPIAGHNAWGQFKTVIESIKRRYLICEDALIYQTFLGENNLTKINPVDLLLAPPSIEYCKSLDNFMALLTDTLNQIVCARFTRHNGETIHYLVHDHIEITAEPLKSWLKKLATCLNPHPISTSISDIITLLGGNDVDQELYEHLKGYDEEHDMVVVESFNNAAIPFTSMLNFDIDEVLVVSPLHVLVFDSKIFTHNARQRLISKGFEGLETDKVIENLNFKAIFNLKPAPSISDFDVSEIAKYIIKK
ncbi:MAG: hypothetical protein ACXQTI_02475 [Candidatus Nezhaarchaeales archaeon]